MSRIVFLHFPSFFSKQICYSGSNLSLVQVVYFNLPLPKGSEVSCHIDSIYFYFQLSNCVSSGLEQNQVVCTEERDYILVIRQLPRILS